MKRVLSNDFVFLIGQTRNLPWILWLFYVFNIQSMGNNETIYKKLAVHLPLPYILSDWRLVTNDVSIIRLVYSLCFSDINMRTLAYMIIDFNRRTLTRYNYIDVLDTIDQLRRQLPIDSIDQVRLNTTSTLVNYQTIYF
jgi:hypothetical protein